MTASLLRQNVTKITLKTLGVFAALGMLGLSTAGLLIMLAYFYVAPSLPDVSVLQDVRLQEPLRIYTADGKLMGEFGEKRRVPVTYEAMPVRLVQAFIASEDDRFYEHPGVDYHGLMRAAWKLARTGKLKQGGSTITMQVARGYFLTPEKKFIRKFREIFLALQMERQLSKQAILTLYLNEIFLGQRAYGVAAAANVYFGKTLPELTLSEMAIIAGLPQAPSRLNPVSSTERAAKRRAYVLRRMHELEFIDDQERDQALAERIVSQVHRVPTEVDAPYLAEMVRLSLTPLLGDGLYTEGYEVTTTLDANLQNAAKQALRQGLEAYDQRHGFRGVLASVETLPEDLPALADALAPFPKMGDAQAVMMIKLEEDQAVMANEQHTFRWQLSDVAWAKKFIDQERVGGPLKRVTDVLNVGDIVYARAQSNEGEVTWQLVQVPDAQGAFVALRPQDGAILALSGGYDFRRNKFNRATQAKRQPGSTFKPFIYAAALNQGFTPASIFLDIPMVLEEGLDVWRPDNYSEGFDGPLRLRDALARSRNLVSIRVLRKVGLGNAVNYLQRFGFGKLNKNYTLALGSVAVTPLQLARGYATFANGGYLIEPHFIQSVRAQSGELLYQGWPQTVCELCEQPEGAMESLAVYANQSAMTKVTIDAEGEASAIDARVAPQVIEPRVAYQMADMMQDVITYGTAKKAKVLGRRDLSGKTGTTNDYRDAWFAGFNAKLVGVAWMGFDQERSLGRGEAGGRAALPIWIDFMKAALANQPEASLARPSGLVDVQVLKATGTPALFGDADSYTEVFRAENAPSFAEAPTPGADLPDLFGDDGERLQDDDMDTALDAPTGQSVRPSSRSLSEELF